MAEAAAAVAAGTETQDVALVANSQEGASPGGGVNMPVGATTAEDFLQPTGSARRLCLCRGNCNGRIRHEAGQCGKRSVSDRPLCSSCKAHKGSSLEKTRTPEEYAAGNFYEQVGTSGEGAEVDGQQQQQQGGDGNTDPNAIPMEVNMGGQGASGLKS